MITKLSVQHYRSIESLDLTFNRVNILVGQNGAGKTNVIDVIRFVRDALANGLDYAITERGIHSIRQWSPTRPYNITISIEGEEKLPHLYAAKARLSFTLSSVGDGYAVRREEGWQEILIYDNDKIIKNESNYNRNEYGICEIIEDGEREELKLKDVSELFVNARFLGRFNVLSRLFVDCAIYSIFPHTLLQAEKESNERYLMSHGENLTSVLKRLRKEKKSDAISSITRAMSQVIPDLDVIKVAGFGGFLTPQFQVESGGKKHVFNVSQMSDGTLRVLGILVALYQEPRPLTVALEEPELAIHPGLLRVIAESIDEASLGTQIFVTTHSPNLLDYFDPDNIIAVEMVDGITTTGRLNSAQMEAVKSNLFSLGELMSIEGLHQ